MKISCCFLYVISKYGYPPDVKDVLKCIPEIRNLGFEYLELEGIGNEHMHGMERQRKALKQGCDDAQMEVVNFGAGMIQVDSFTPALRFVGGEPYRKSVVYGESYRIAVECDRGQHRPLL